MRHVAKTAEFAIEYDGIEDQHLTSDRAGVRRVARKTGRAAAAARRTEIERSSSADVTLNSEGGPTDQA